MTGEQMISNDDAPNGLKPYATPHLVHLSHRATESGTTNVTSDANETVINTVASVASAPS